MTGLILAAGYGTRMYPLTENTPKALLPVGGKSILEHLIAKLALVEPKVGRIVIVSNHRFAPMFTEWAKRSKLPFAYAVLDDGTTSDENRLGSMGDLAFAIQKAKIEDDLLILASDNLFEEELSGFSKYALSKGEITLGAYELPDKTLASKYGVLEVDAQKKITAFTEKPPSPKSSLVSTAVYFFPRKALNVVLEYVSSAKAADTLGSFIAWLIARQTVYAYRLSGRWFDIGDIASYKHAQETFH